MAAGRALGKGEAQLRVQDGRRSAAKPAASGVEDLEAIGLQIEEARAALAVGARTGRGGLGAGYFAAPGLPLAAAGGSGGFASRSARFLLKKRSPLQEAILITKGDCSLLA